MVQPVRTYEEYWINTAASEEQAAQTDEVRRSIESISAASQEAAAAVEETAATSQSLAQLAEGLNTSVSQFIIK